MCACAIKSGSSVYMIDTCGPDFKKGQTNVKLPPRLKMTNCEIGKQEMVIKIEGNRYTVSSRFYFDVHGYAYETLTINF